MTRQDLEQRVTRAAERALAEQRFVSAIDVLLGLGWLVPSHLERWQQGRVESLERVVQANLSKVTVAMATLRRWARGRGLNPSETLTASSGQHVNGLLIVSCCRGGGQFLINAPSR